MASKNSLVEEIESSQGDLTQPSAIPRRTIPTAQVNPHRLNLTHPSKHVPQFRCLIPHKEHIKLV
ncbi:hypothetical protein JHK82_033680 [Glycine max]|uniref:Uncharacterized protein n=2 Tax=Glycine subgen. Soja TaxID=1462606 RepID=K7LUK6_SOYBN|nr:hypothetical protein JHK87_033626 [Glycine soja]KAG4980440.1 hypothetical protein JHK85_034398 [Glycine max]KAG4986070.1 hypothetical protein JHK86_033761 [Glycine max]KAG5119260.1 hypothetical protein JHK82_033680 [Glycine max]KAG5140254.1 hypothetical protein JHK84_034022 [Glycine max]